MPDRDILDLEHFLPYRLSVLSNRISQDIARLYADRFGLGITEWRVLAVLGRYPGLSASQLAERTAMDKVAVSRAVASLLAAGRVTRTTHGDDRRRSVLELSGEGQRVYAEVAPAAIAYERRLLACLCPEDQSALSRLLQQLADAEQKTS
jgi:DNA-binding MarR family transcriptional regulator